MKTRTTSTLLVGITGMICLAILSALTAAPVAQGGPSGQLDPTDQQRTIDAAVQQALQQTAQAQQAEPDMTQTIEAAIWQAATATAQASGAAPAQQEGFQQGGPSGAPAAQQFGQEGAGAPQAAPDSAAPPPAAAPAGPVAVQPITVANANRLTQLFALGKGAIDSFALTADGRSIAAVATTGIHLYNTNLLGQVQGELPTGHAYAVAWSPNGATLAVGVEGGAIELWDVAAGQRTATLTGHPDAITHLDWSPDGARLASSGGYDASARVWDVATGTQIAVIEQHAVGEHYMNYISWSPDGARLATGGWDGMVRVYDGRTLYLLRELDHTIWVNCVEWSPDGSRLASGADNNTIRVWDPDSGQTLSIVEGPSDPDEDMLPVFWRLAWSPDGSKIVGAARPMGNKGVPGVQVWDVASERLLATFMDETSIVAVNWLDRGRVLAAVDSGLIAFDVNSGRETLVADHATTSLNVSWSPDGGRFVVGYSNGTAVIWDAFTGEPVVELPGTADRYSQVAWSPDGSKIAGVEYRSQVIDIWHATSGAHLNSWRAGNGESSVDIAWLPDGTRLAARMSEEYTHKIRVWEVTTGTQLLETGLAGSGGLAWSPDGTRIAASGYDFIEFWDAGGGFKLTTWDLEGAEYIGEVAFSPDGSRLGAICNDGTLRIFDALSGEELYTKRLPDEYSDGVAWSPDGSMVMTFNSGYAYFWRTEGSTPFAVVDLPIYWLSGAPSWSPDGMRIAWASYGQPIQVWGVPQ